MLDVVPSLGVRGVVGVRCASQVAGKVRWLGPHHLRGVACSLVTLALITGLIGTVLAVSVAGPWVSPTAASGAPGSWQTEKTYAPQEGFTAISCPSPLDCFAVPLGAPDAVVATTNGGTSWTFQQLPAGTTLLSISCPSTTFCAAVGSNSVVTTTNGGASWAAGSLPSPGTDAISCASATVCVAVGGGSSAVTKNGGASWNAGGTLTGVIAGISCPSTTFCAAVGNNGGICVGPPLNVCNEATVLATTVDGGATWTTQSPGAPGDSFGAVSCPSTSECTAVGRGQSPTSGFAYTDLVSGTCAMGPGCDQPEATGSASSGVSCPSMSMCIAVGLDQIAIANTGATSWTTQAADSLNSFESLRGVSCASTSNCMAAGGADADGPPNVMRTSDGGASWAKVFAIPFSVQEFAAISCPSQSACTAVGRANGALGSAGSVAHSNDGGSTWTLQILPSGIGPLSGVSCASTTVCEAVGETPGATGPVIVATTNGGASWQSQNVPQGISALYQLSCPSTTECTAVGGPSNGGAIISTTDGGATWTSQTVPSGVLDGLSTVSCPSVTTCFAISGFVSNSPVVVTTDGGTTWTSETPPSNLFLSSISCPTTTTCTAIGSSESNADTAIIGTTDGGATWTTETLPSSLSGPVESELDISCQSQMSCTAVGGSTTGVVLATNDGGTTWTGESTPVPAPAWGLTGVSCPVVGACTSVGFEWYTPNAEGGIIMGQAPTTSVFLPSNGATLSGSAWLDAGASSPVGLTSVSFELSGGSFADRIISASAPTLYGWIGGWNTTDVPNGTYTLQSVATDTSGISTTSAPISVTVDNQPPQTAVLVPAGGATLSGTAAVLDASASGTSRIISVQFELNGGGLSNDVVGTAAPTLYGWIAEWDTTKVPNGMYTLRSVATDAESATATSPAISVKVLNRR